MISSVSSTFCAYSRPSNNSGAHFVPGKGPGGQGSLWIEEREGRIKVLDIKGVCDDGIDTLEPQLQPICDWIDKAREEGGKVLVHCRVGVSRSATVVIAYVMKHLSLPLVDAYLIVRSRRLSVLIQPNMRLLYNLLGWEVKLARERTDAALPEDKCAGMSSGEAREEEDVAAVRARARAELAVPRQGGARTQREVPPLDGSVALGVRCRARTHVSSLRAPLFLSIGPLFLTPTPSCALCSSSIPFRSTPPQAPMTRARHQHNTCTTTL